MKLARFEAAQIPSGAGSTTSAESGADRYGALPWTIFTSSPLSVRIIVHPSIYIRRTTRNYTVQQNQTVHPRLSKP